MWAAWVAASFIGAEVCSAGLTYLVWYCLLRMNAHPVDRARKPIDLDLLPTVNTIPGVSSPTWKLSRKIVLAKNSLQSPGVRHDIPAFRQRPPGRATPMSETAPPARISSPSEGEEWVVGPFRFAGYPFHERISKRNGVYRE